MKTDFLNNSPPAPLFVKRGVTHVLRHVVSPENEFPIGSKEPQSGAIFIEEHTPINLEPLFEKLPFRNMFHKIQEKYYKTINYSDQYEPGAL